MKTVMKILWTDSTVTSIADSSPWTPVAMSIRSVLADHSCSNAKAQDYG